VSTAAPTDLLVALEPLPARCALLRFKLLASGATEDFVLHDVERRVEALKETLPQWLTDFRVAISPPHTVRLDPDRADRALRRLQRLAFGLLDLLLEQSEHSPRAFVDKLSRFLLPLTRARKDTAPVVELSADEAYPLTWQLPLELLPVIRPQRSAAAAASRLAAAPDPLGFLGMLAVIVRRRRPAGGPAPVKSGRTPLSVVTYRSPESLPGIAAQIEFFRQRSTAFALDARTVWPQDDALDEDDAVAELAAIMARLPGRPQKPAGRRPVLHFCCHYRAGGAQDREATPALGLTPDVDVGITALRGELAALPEPVDELAARALVFVNACRSAHWNRRDDSLLRLLFRRGYCHVIGGETLLPDRFAGEFARQVYARALRGQTIGLAVWRTRRYLLQRFNNPGGLLYTVYGSPDLRLQ
jgi:hypothetical protein